MDEKVSQIVDITGAAADQAQHLLEASGGDLDSAVELYFATTGGGAALDEDSEALARRMAHEGSVHPFGVDAANEQHGVPPGEMGHQHLDPEGIRRPDDARTERLFDVGAGPMGFAMPRHPRARLPEQRGAGINLSDTSNQGLDAIYKPPDDLMSDLTLEECGSGIGFCFARVALTCMPKAPD
jgi:UBA-like domain